MISNQLLLGGAQQQVNTSPISVTDIVQLYLLNKFYIKYKILKKYIV